MKYLIVLLTLMLSGCTAYLTPDQLRYAEEVLCRDSEIDRIIIRTFDNRVAVICTSGDYFETIQGNYIRWKDNIAN